MSQFVLVLNSGSSSVKYQLYDMDDGPPHPVAHGLVERIGEDEGHLTHHGPDGATERAVVVPDHAAALHQMLDAFADHGGLPPLHAVGHRVVHGGERFTEPTPITAEVVAAIRDLVPLAPLHNPANLLGIQESLTRWPDVPQVAVFDTAFHRTLAPAAYRYAVPAALYRDLGVRRYGFHGTSYQYVAKRAAALLGRAADAVDLVVLHLGNGASACAVQGGRSIDTSMGLGPLEGLVMGTRSGDIDPTVVFHLARVGGLTLDKVDDLLNRHSGLLGLAGANDMRTVVERAAAGDPDAALALDVAGHRLRKYVGAYLALLGGRADAVVFTAGIGEHSPEVRARACAGLEGFGIVLDAARNQAPGGGERVISADASAITVLVVPTDEEREIALQAVAVVG